MQRLFEALNSQVLPMARSGDGCFLPQMSSAPAEADTMRHKDFLEAYPYVGQGHTYFEWMWLLDGQAHMKIDGRIYDLAPGDFCFLPPQHFHADVYNAATPAYRSLWCSYSREVISSHLFSYRPVGKWEILTYCRAPAVPEISRVLTALQAEMGQRDGYAEEARHVLVHELVLHLLRLLEPVCREGKSGELPGHASRRALQYLRQHYAKNVTLHEVARAAFLSPHYLAAVFKQETGQTVFDALTQIRMEHAKRLLLENRLPVQEIAAQVGYSSPHHFSRAFRRSAGVPPSRYGTKSSTLISRDNGA